MATKYPSVTLQGNILTFDALEQIAAGKDAPDMPRQTARDYGFATELELRNEIQEQWAVAKTQYAAFKLQIGRLKEDDTGVTQARSGWMIPLLGLLGYELRYTSAQTIDDRSYAISHAASETGFPVHIAGAKQSLDRKGSNMRMSPHALVQEYLNRHDNLYAVVTNGCSLRLLRDSANLSKLSYVEFDLTRLFEEDLYTDFALLFRLLHTSRLPEESTAGTDSILEKYHQEALKSGSRIREKLSEAVKEGILRLANGLLANTANTDLRNWAAQHPDTTPEAYYEALLKLIYRLLFVMVIEERDLIFPKADAPATDDGLDYMRGPAPKAARDIYYEFYSLKRLRGLALNYRLANDREYDLWESLLNTFALFEDRGKGVKLGIAPLAGSLFKVDALSALRGGSVNNQALLECLRGLSQFDDGQGGIMPINYASLDVEEFGSVYEGLLDYKPAIATGTLHFDFVKGQGRSTSGSHYTPDELVQPLIKHSLDHLIADRTVAPDASQDKRDAAIRQLLQLQVADITCGSGHILLAAGRRIGLEVARLRSGEEQPNPMAIREGTRAAIQNCIYGVDLNPLAVELCKVALWLEAHIPGKPLGFLDHRIRCGDAIMGVGHLGDLQKGIATEAFKEYTPEEKSTATLLRKQNKKEVKDREAGGSQLTLMNGEDNVKDRLTAFRKNFAQFAEMPEETVAEIKAKERAFKALSIGSNWWFIKMLCDLQTAQFFVPKTDEKLVVTDSQYFEMMRGTLKNGQAEAQALAQSAKRKFFHWFLEFPEVFAEGGFDCVLGNPPFLGGTKISTSTSGQYLNLLHKVYYPAKGRADLVVYFMRRIHDLISSPGYFSILSTNSISQGDSREGGLAVILNQGSRISHAVRSTPWPGLASVEVSLVTISKGSDHYAPVLNKLKTDLISSYLDDQQALGDPFKIIANKGLAFNGTYARGKGFVITNAEAEELLKISSTNAEVIRPYLTGDDLNNRLGSTASRSVIFFRDWPKRKYSTEEWNSLSQVSCLRITSRLASGKFVKIAPPAYTGPVAADYPEPFKILKERTKPEREAIVTAKVAKGKNPSKEDLEAASTWWRFWRTRSNLYEAIQKMDNVLVINRHSKITIIASVSNCQIYSDATVVFACLPTVYSATLNSDFHVQWAWKYSSTIRDSSLRYSGTDAFETFPFPETTGLLGEQSQALHELRDRMTNGLNLGLTESYKLLHNAHLTSDYETLWQDGALTIKLSDLKKRKQSKETYNLYRHLEKTPDTLPIGEAVERIAELRTLHKQMDEAVLAAYGWHIDTRRWGKAIRLRHDFRKVDYLPDTDNVRYTIHPEARREVLKRLLLLNHEIHEAETRKNADGTIGVDYEAVDAEKVTALMLEQVQAWYPQAKQLHWKTLKFLCTGEDLLPNLEASLTKSYKPFVTAYASALENELLERIFVPYNERFQRVSLFREDKPETGSVGEKAKAERGGYLKAQAAIDPSKLGKFTGMLRKGDTKYELGTMQYLLNLVWKETGNTFSRSGLLQDFRRFVVAKAGEEVLKRTFLDNLKDLAERYRNAAAHTGEVDMEMADGCKEAVRGLIREMFSGKAGVN